MIKKAVNILLILVGAGVILGAIVVLVVLPRLDWSATAKPPVIEKRLAGLIMDRWVRLSAPVENNPMAASAENLKLGQQEFEEHCAVCHAPMAARRIFWAPTSIHRFRGWSVAHQDRPTESCIS
jgi:hypothetical protein